MILEREQDVTPAVTEAMVCIRDPRLREILVALVRHLHAFVREVRLKEDEFRAATDIINQLGRQSNDRADGRLARGLVPDLPFEQRRQRTDRDVAIAARAVLATELASRRQRRHDRPLRYARRTAVRARAGGRSRRRSSRGRGG